LTLLKIEKTQEATMVVADLDGTLLHDGETFEERFLTQYSVDVINRMHDNGIVFAVETARPVSTGFSFVEKLPVDAVAYLNGALIDFNPASSNYEMLTSPTLPEDGHLKKIGFSSKRACEVCKNLLAELPGMEVGIVMDDASLRFLAGQTAFAKADGFVVQAEQFHVMSGFLRTSGKFTGQHFGVAVLAGAGRKDQDVFLHGNRSPSIFIVDGWGVPPSIWR